MMTHQVHCPVTILCWLMPTHTQSYVNQIQLQAVAQCVLICEQAHRHTIEPFDHQAEISP